jgi:predicted Zn-dependent peptidase
MTPGTTTRFIFLLVVLLAGEPILAGEYTPPGLYDVEYYQLPNQMSVLLKERHQARSVSYRIIVNHGSVDYPCGHKETPHFLEHLLFTGTSIHEESELDDLIEGHGGSWNAYTTDHETGYTLDIFSKHAALGLETLHEIITDSQITQENVDTSRDIIHREAGGRPSAFKQWTSEMGLGETGFSFAYDTALAGTPYVCKRLETADNIERTDLLEAYHRYYAPNNMTLIVVGDFDSTEMKKNIELTFGAMEGGEDFQRPAYRPELNTEKLLFTSTLSPLVDSEAEVGIVYTSGGYLSPDYYPSWFIENYLADRLYKKLRVEEGLSYSPSSGIDNYPETGVWYTYADTGLDTITEVLGLIEAEINELVQKPIDEEQLSLMKDKLLMSIVQGYESNTEIADYYADSFHELEIFGSLVREEDEINAVTVEEVQRVAKEIFGKTPPIVYHNTPTMTYAQLGIALGILGLGLLYFLTRRLLRARKV